MVRGFRKGIARMAAGTCAAVALALTCGCSLTTPTLAEVEEPSIAPAVGDASLVTPGTLTVALDTTDAPQAMTDMDGRIIGYAPDVARALASSMGLKVAFVPAASAAGSVGEGAADIYLGATSTATGDDVTSVGEYLEDAVAVFGARKSTIHTASASDLADARIGVQESSASQDALNRAGIAGTQSTYANINECFDALAAGEVDYVACDATAGAYLARAYPDIMFVGTISSSSTCTIVCSGASAELQQALSETFDAISADGTLDALHTLWYGDMPESLGATLLSGVTISAATDEDDDESSSADDENTEGIPTITDDDINKLSS